MLSLYVQHSRNFTDYVDGLSSNYADPTFLSSEDAHFSNSYSPVSSGEKIVILIKTMLSII